VDVPAPSGSRKAKRVEVSLRVELRRAAGPPLEIEVLDLSFYGLRARSSADLRLGEFVKVDLPPFGLVRARISWVRSGMFGCAFPTALDVRKCVGENVLDTAQPEA
jgi:hypothetical protein